MNDGPGTVILRPVYAWLVNPRGGLGDQVFRLAVGGRTIGRTTPSDIVLRDAGASAEHARVSARSEADGRMVFHVEDLKSTNGTWLNGALTPGGPLKDHDRLEIGSTVLIFRQL